MANLSNINNILRTGSLGVGINRDPASPFEVSSSTKPGIKMFNTAASGKTYQAYSDVNGNYIIYDEDADSNRLVINSAGNATFAGTISSSSISAEGMITVTQNDIGTGESVGLRIIRSGGAQIWNITSGITGVDNTTFNVRNSTSNTNVFSIDAGTNAATFAGMITVNGGGIDIDNDDDVRLRFDNASTFKAGLQVATTAGDMIAASAVNDFAIRAQANMLFATGGNTERMRIFSNGNVNIGVAEAGASAVTGPFVVTHTSSRFLTSSYEESAVSLSAKNNNNNLETLRLAGDSIKFFNGTNAVGSQKMVILNSGNVGIGETSPDDKLHVSGGNVRIYSTNNANHLILKNNATATSGLFEERIKFLGWSDNENASIIAKGNAYFGSPVNILAFSVSASEKMSINDSGNIAISGAGIQIDRPDVAGGKPYVFWKSGGTTQASIYGASGTSKGLRFFLEGGIADFNNNIKASGVYLGGSGSANLLDDYEEGTWTPAVSGVTLSTASGRYIKIGNMVTVFGIIRHSSGTSTGNTVTGLPFTTSGLSRSPMSFSQIDDCNWGSGATMLVSFISSSNFAMYGNSNGGPYIQVPNNWFGAGAFLEFGGTYMIF